MANQKILRYGTAGQWMIVMDGDRGIAPGGFNRQILTKVSGTDYDAQWRDPAGFTFTQGAAPTLGLDGTSALVTGQTWFDTTTGNGYVRVATSWVQFAWGDSESRYVNAVGDTMNGQLVINGGGGETLELKPGTSDHVYIEFFARTATPASRSGYFGYPAAGTNNLTLANSLPGDIVLSPSTGRVQVNADPTAALHVATKQYVDATDVLKLTKSGDTMSGILTMNANINMGTGRKIDFTDELGMKVDLYGGSYWLGIASGTLQYASGGVHQFYGQVNVDSHFSAAGSVYANSGRVRMGAWQSAPYAAGWGGLVGSRGYILIDYSDGSGGNMHVRGNNNLYVGGGSADDIYFTGTGIRSVNPHYHSSAIYGDSSCVIAGDGSFGGKTGIGSWASDGNYCCVWGHYGYHLMGKGGVDGAVHTRGNNAGWNHYIGAGSYIQLEQWTIAALGGGSGGTVVQKLDGVLANAASRRILKEQIEPLPEKVDAGAVIDALEPVTFIWRKRDDVMSQFYAMQRSHMDQPHDGEYGPICIPEEVAAAVPYYDDDAAEVWRKADLRIGLIADDVAVVRPELANWEWEKDADGKNTDELIPGSWNEQAMISVLIQGVKDLRARVAALEA